MTAPTPDPIPDPAVPRVDIHWPRVRLYFWGIVLMVTLWVCGSVVTLRVHPERFVNKLLAQLPFYSSTGKVAWLNRRTLQIDDVKLGGFFYADSIVVTASPLGLLRHHVAKVQILGGQLFTKPLYDEMDKMGSGSSDGLDWTIGRLEISRGMLLLNNFIEDTSIPVRLGVRTPIVLNGLRLGKPDASSDMTRERMVEIGNVVIGSPVDPLAPVLAFPLTRLRFTYDEIWHHHIREIDMIRPTMFLGEDLFWFTSEFSKEHKATSATAQGPSAPWEIGHFEVQYGRLAINAFGQPVVRLPFFVQTQVDNIRLDQLDKISAKSTIIIKRLDQDYPDYKIQLVDLEGWLYFSLPPTDATANNVVNYIRIEKASWNGIPVTKATTNVTFDATGVYGKLNGTCEGGQLTGNFEFYYTKGFTWNVDFFADKLNIQPIAEKMGGKYLNLTGELDGKLSVQGRTTEIQNCQGSLTLPRPGVLEIKSMSDLMNRLPADASNLKKDLMKIAIETFQTYPYESGELNIGYKPGGGVGTLKLDSPNGQRRFDMYWHPYDSSKVAKDTDNQ